MKKTLLLLAAVIINMAAYAQTSLGTIPYTSADATFSGKTLAVPASFTCSSGMGIYVYNQAFTGTDYWDLNSYTGIAMDMTVDAAYVGQSFTLRFVMVGTVGNSSSATSILKTCTFSSATQTFTFDFAADASPTKCLWAIKVPWDGTTGFPVTINSLVATSSTTGLNTTTAADPDKIVNVYNLSGASVRTAVKQSEATIGLEKGFYIVDNKKVFVLNQ